MSQISRFTAEQIAATYRLMSERARYRPAAPSDGLGNVSFPEEELVIDEEIVDYIKRWWSEEDEMSFFLGCAHGPFRPAMILAVEAARNTCSGWGHKDIAIDLLRLAIEELEKVEEPDYMR